MPLLRCFRTPLQVKLPLMVVKMMLNGGPESEISRFLVEASIFWWTQNGNKVHHWGACSLAHVSRLHLNWASLRQAAILVHQYLVSFVDFGTSLLNTKSNAAVLSKSKTWSCRFHVLKRNQTTHWCKTFRALEKARTKAPKIDLTFSWLTWFPWTCHSWAVTWVHIFFRFCCTCWIEYKWSWS